MALFPNSFPSLPIGGSISPSVMALPCSYWVVKIVIVGHCFWIPSRILLALWDTVTDYHTVKQSLERGVHLAVGKLITNLMLPWTLLKSLWKIIMLLTSGQYFNLLWSLDSWNNFAFTVKLQFMFFSFALSVNSIQVNLLTSSQSKHTKH